MDENEKKLVEELKGAGDRLSKPPASSEDLLILLDEVELLLGKVDQSASPLVQQALLPAMKALVSDQLFRNPVMDVKITVATCLNEIMRITAPDAPYNDDRMKEFFELIVASFDKLSLVSGRSYTKAVSIIDNVSKVKSCVMMLDLECDALIVKMFEQFLKNIRSDHPDTVFMAMEAIMTLIIEESEDISLELLKVILLFVRKENQKDSPMAWKLGSKVIESCAEKLKPYLVSAINSVEISMDDYGPIVASIFEHASDAGKQNHANALGVGKHPQPGAPIGELGQSGRKKSEQDAGTKRKDSKQIDGPQNADAKVKARQGMGSRTISDKKTQKPTSLNANQRRGRPPSIQKAKEHFLASPQAQPAKSSALSNTSREEATPASGGLVVPKEEPIDGGDFHVTPSALHEQSDGKKRQRKRKEMSEGSEVKRPLSSSKPKGRPRVKIEGQEDITAKKVPRRKQSLETDEVFETPHGKKRYKEDLIGCRVKVWWPKDKTYYEGVVAAFDASKMKHRIEYDDGDEEILNLRKEIWEMVGDDDDAETADQAARLLTNLKQPKIESETPKAGTMDKGLAPHTDTESKDEEDAETKRRLLVKEQKP